VFQCSNGGGHVLGGDPHRLEHRDRSAPGLCRPVSRSAIEASGGNRPARMRSPASERAASSSSTTTNARRSVPGGISAISGVKAPTALMWVPGKTERSSNRGSVAGVAQQTTSARATAASASAMASPPTLPARSEARPVVRLHTSTRSIERTERTASIWSKAIAPAPSMASTLASGRASRRVARPDAAPVRSLVSSWPSTRPSGSPSGPNTITIPAGRPGTTETTLTPVCPPTRPGMNSEDPSRTRTGTSRSSPNAETIDSIASGMGRAARRAAASRYLMSATRHTSQASPFMPARSGWPRRSAGGRRRAPTSGPRCRNRHRRRSPPAPPSSRSSGRA
jgi:hypothetical protein